MPEENPAVLAHATTTTTTTRRGLLRGALLGGLSILPSARGQVPVQEAETEPGVTRLAQEHPEPTGRAGAGLEVIDAAVRDVFDMYGMVGATVAVAKDGRLVLARGYGWADLAAGVPVRPHTRFCIASCSKSFTGASVLKLVDQGRLDLDARVFPDVLTGLRPFPGEREDPRLARITVRHLLWHAGGWMVHRSGEPMSFSARVARALRKQPPISQVELIRYMMGRPLDFDPGTGSHYSNFGYMILRHVVERVSGQGYEAFCREHVLLPIGIRRMQLELPSPRYAEDEARRYAPEGQHLFPGGHQHMLGAAGSWLASGSDLVRFVAAMSGAGPRQILSPAVREAMLAPPPPPMPIQPNGGHPGLGWDSVVPKPNGVQFGKDGGVAGIEAWIEHLAGGVSWAVVFNSSHHKQPEMPQPMGVLRRKLLEIADRPREWPDIDLFQDETL